jgi:hypothetical protein
MAKRLKCYDSIAGYGVSGAGKTTQGSELARHIRKVLGPDKVLRLASANANGWGVIQPDIDAGYIIPTWVPSRKHIIQTIDRFTKGWWPADPEDPESPLLPPDRQPDLAKVGGTMFDSGTDFADLIMRYALGRESEKGSTFKIAAEAASHTYYDGEANDATGYASAARGHYGADQNRMEQFICQSRDIPNQFIYWTFLEDRGKDPVTKSPVYAPDVIGSAINGKVPSWFGRTVRLAVTFDAEGKARRAMFLHNHYYPGDPIPYLANVRDYWKFPLPDFMTGAEVSLFTLYEKLSENYKRAVEAQSTPRKDKA